MFDRLLITGSVPDVRLESISQKLLETSLVAEAAGYRELPGDLRKFDGAVLCVASYDLAGWAEKVRSLKQMPLYWWCSDPSSQPAPEFPGLPSKLCCMTE